MKEKVKKGGKDEEVNGQGGKRGAPAPHGAMRKTEKCRVKYNLLGRGKE